ncbi:MAG: hypothetical protein JHD02_06450 [Thermoleophilaceae bacterium]|nr:hypothetical protein [Thermoleophilaceae bacterium]
MKRTFSNRPVAAIVAVFTLISAWLLHNNPFGSGTFAWPVSLLVALLGNLFLAYVLTAWAAPYLVSTGGQSGASKADPHDVAVAERWTAGTLLLFGSLSLFAVTIAATEFVITPSKRLDQNAALVKRTVELEAPPIYKRQLAGADTWKMSERTYRTCVPTPESVKTGWCVVTQVQNDKLVVVKYGSGKSNAAQALEWHPELADQRR